MLMSVAEQVRGLKQGRHACFFFDTVAQQMQVTVPFLQAGLKLGERCVFLGDPINVRHLKNTLMAAGTDVVAEEARGALALTSDRYYLVDGRFDPAETIRFLDQAIEDALKAGFSGLRATGVVVWEIGAQKDYGVLVPYEQALDKFFHGKKLTGLCQYKIQNSLRPHYGELVKAHSITLNASAVPVI